MSEGRPYTGNDWDVDDDLAWPEHGMSEEAWWISGRFVT